MDKKTKDRLNLFPPCTNNVSLLVRIKTRGSYEQERQYLFPVLYGSKAVNRNTIGEFKQFDRKLKQGKFAI